MNRNRGPMTRLPEWAYVLSFVLVLFLIFSYPADSYSTVENVTRVFVDILSSVGTFLADDLFEI